MARDFGLSDVQALMGEFCAPWINQLDLRITDIHADGADFLWRPTDDICRVVDAQTKIVSGQATMAVADTASFMTICAVHGQHRNCTTVDLSANFMRPLFAGDIVVNMRALSLGRQLVTMRAEFRQEGQAKLGAQATAVFAYI